MPLKSVANEDNNALIRMGCAVKAVEFTRPEQLMFQDLVGQKSAQRRQLLLIYALLGGAALILRAIDPAGSRWYPQCPLRVVTGLHCPGCGSLRAIHQALQGNFGTAFRLNPLLFFLVPLAVYPVASDVRLMILGRPLPRVRLFHGWWLILVGVIGVFGVLRNVPYYPFTLLGP